MNKSKTILLSALLSCELFGGVGGLTGYYGFEDPEQVQKKDENKTSVEAYTKELRPQIEDAIKNPRKYTVPQFSEIMTKGRQLSLTTMEKRDIVNYMKLENIMQEQADTYQEQWRKLKLEQPELDYTRNMAKSRFARVAERDIRKAEREKFWKENINRIGIVTFIDPKQFENNEAQRKVLNLLALDYPQLDIRILDKVTYSKMIKNLGVVNFPDTWMIYKGKNGSPQWYRVANGMSAKDQILDGIDFVYESYIEGKQ